MGNGDGDRSVCFSTHHEQGGPYSPHEAERQTNHRAQVIKALKAELARHKDLRATAK
jgi:hypothetical protein